MSCQLGNIDIFCFLLDAMIVNNITTPKQPLAEYNLAQQYPSVVDQIVTTFRAASSDNWIEDSPCGQLSKQHIGHTDTIPLFLYHIAVKYQQVNISPASHY